MTVAPERPMHPARLASGHATGLLDLADSVYQNLPGYRPEIVEGRLVVNPPPDGRYAVSLTALTLALAHLHGGETRVAHSLGLWLPTGEEDYVVPDLAVVEADAMDHVVAFNCCAPHVFRMALEITSTQRGGDTAAKAATYAAAGVPVYAVADRKAREAVILSDLRDGEYRVRAVYRPGETFTLPGSIGATAELQTDTFLG